MNTDATAERIANETERRELHGAFQRPRRSHRLRWIVLLAVLVGIALGIVTHK